MEGDDEFGDLYADVLLPFASTSSSAPHPPQSSAASPSSTRLFDLNLQTDNEEIIHGASYANSAVPHQSSDQTTSPNQGNSVKESILAATSNSMQMESVEGARILECGHTKPVEGAKILELGDAELADRALPDMNHDKESGIDDVGSELAVKGDGSIDKDVKFDIEEVGEGLEDVSSDPIIPGLSSGGVVVVAEAGEEEADDWDSDSEDDLPIVLCDNNHMKVERGGMAGDDEEEDEDSELVIVADSDPNQAVEEQEWGENTAQTADGERKDMAELAKASGGVTMVPKVGYSSHGYHPFHSQFKYVRLGAVPMPGATPSAPGVSTGEIRPLANMVPMAGRGRGDWRPPGIKGAVALQKGFHAGPGLPGWGNGATRRGFGGGLEFTLPSHKTIFDVDVESFEEKPWKYPGVDASDFFNFGLNEETWKDYCRQLQQLRLESTMQSKIRVYESGRSEQEYDPDLPPELAAASGIHDNLVENTNSIRSDIGRSDLAKASRLVRPPLPTGRAIQVETGYGERLPSVDTRPPRIRDSDAIIEIVLQDSADDNSFAGVGVQDQSEGREPQREDFREDDVAGDEIPRVEHEYFDGFSRNYNGRKGELVGRRMPFMNSSPADIPVGDAKEPANYLSSRGQIPRPSGVNFGSSYEGRRMQGKASSCITPIRDKAIDDNGKKDSVESMEGRDNANLSSPIIKDARGSSVEDKDADLDETGSAAENSMEKEDIDLNTVDISNNLKDREGKRQKSMSQVEEPLLDDVNDWENSRAARSSDNSKGSSVRSKDYQKRHDEEELAQDAQSAPLGSNRRSPDKNGHDFCGREHDGKQEPERNCLLHKSREKSYPYKDHHLGSAHQLQMKTGGFDRQKYRDNSDMSRARRADDPFGRRVRNDEPRKGEKGKVRENERSDRDGSLHSRKQLDNGSFRVPHDKNVALRDSRHRERDDIMKSRYESLEDYHSKRRKDEGYLRRENIDKEDILHGYIESASRHKRGRDLVFDPRKRNDPQRSRAKLDDHYASRSKDELPKERADRQRDMDLEDWRRVKQSHEEHPSKREREGRTAGRSGREAEEKTWVGHVRGQDEHQCSVKEYQSRDTMPSEQLKRRDRIQDESSHHKGREDAYTHRNQYSSEEKRSRQERSNSHSGHAANASDNQRANGRMDKEGTQRSRESGVCDPNSLGLCKRNQEGQSGPSQTTKKGLKDLSDEGRAEQEIPGHRLSRKRQEDISSDDEQQGSHKGHSKLKCWTSQKESGFNTSGKPSSSSKFKDIDEDNKEGSSEAGEPMDVSAKTFDPVDNQHLLSAEGKDSVDMESKDADTNSLGDQRLDTAEKLKKRSERFKLPMPSEKETLTIKKLESEPLPSAKSENSGVSEVKQERPARKRRWISN